MMENADNELARPVTVDALPNDGRTIELAPSEAEVAAVAKRLGLIELNGFDGHVRVIPAMGREIEVTGRIRAKIVQTCIATGNPLTTSLEFDLQRRYAEDADAFTGVDVDEDELTDPNDDIPDPIENGVIDVGEAAVEELALQMPAFPRTPDAAYADATAEPTPEEAATKSPFGQLAELKNKMESED